MSVAAPRVRLILLAVTIATSVAACGGGGGGSTASENPPPVDAPSPEVPEPSAPLFPPEPWPDDVPPSAPLGGVGYTARACGFDLNANGIRGEPEDCRVCDGSTTDVNADGVVDRIVYVDCDGRGGDGTPGSPFASITRAMSVLSPPVSDVLQAVCFRGRCAETVVPSVSGAVGTAALEGFERARFPLLLSGWDSDGDGSYPPFDPDDEAVLDGSAGLDFAVVNDQGESRVELAHFTAEAYGADCAEEAGFLRPARGGGAVTHVSVHDVELSGMSGGCPAGSGRSVFFLFVEGSPLSFFSVSNVLVSEYGGYAVRGSGAGRQVLGPYRFDHLTVRPRGPAGGFAHGIKLWDYIDGIEVLQNLFDANPDAWRPCASRVDVAGCEPTYAITAAQCTRGWVIRGNEFRDWKYAIGVQPDAGASFCRDRDMDGILIDQNRILADYEPWRYGDVAIRIDRGEDATVRTVDVTGNEMRTSVGWESCVWSNAGLDAKSQEGMVRILRNTCVGPVNRYAALTVGAPAGEGGEPANPQQRYEVRENLFADIGSVNVNTGYVVDGFVASDNVYDPAAGFSWDHDAAGEVRQPTFDAWSLVSGEEASSLACEASRIAGTAVCR